ncbi:PPE family protein [Mycobacterium haemophilum DSM 44634]|uniref:PPE family protein n=1 Tax=Mycobacterium haemophilum TaxID=29311 RepID=UPI0006D47ED7|nr:PPE family protein [Mycobacterium haemophilum]ALL56271.1 hypothetical protein B586_13575 [Mycobacterium haemophilum DSM 44634]MCV7341929.1 PPE family protein [Mycobacterium haemophilum DSM 44634]
MTEPLWLAWPPEELSTELNGGVGIGPLLASALHHSGLSVEYRKAALQISIVLEVVAHHGWDGETAEAFVGAYMTLLQWLIRAAADSEEVAAQQELAATAYTVAVASMPTQLELAANRAMWAVLMATNFFGINTIPIAANEAEYAAMWIRAAATMAAYEATSRVVLSSMPELDPPPPILKSDASTWLANSPQVATVALGGVVANLGAATGLAGLSGLADGESSAIPDVVPALVPVAAAPVALTAAWGARTSDFGAESLGFAGTVRNEAVVEVAGLTTLAGDDFGGGPTMPMVPSTWVPDRAGLGEAT